MLSMVPKNRANLNSPCNGEPGGGRVLRPSCGRPAFLTGTPEPAVQLTLT